MERRGRESYCVFFLPPFSHFLCFFLVIFCFQKSGYLCFPFHLFVWPLVCHAFFLLFCFFFLYSFDRPMLMSSSMSWLYLVCNSHYPTPSSFVSVDGQLSVSQSVSEDILLANSSFLWLFGQRDNGSIVNNFELTRRFYYIQYCH